LNPTALCRGLLGCDLLRSAVPATNVKLHGASPWHLGKKGIAWVEANVKLHGASPWHLSRAAGLACPNGGSSRALVAQADSLCYNPATIFAPANPP